MKKRNKFSYILYGGCLIALLGVLFLVFSIKNNKGNLIILHWDTPFYFSERTRDLLNKELQKCGYNVEIVFKYIDWNSYYDEVKQDIKEEDLDLLFSGMISWQKVGRRYALVNQLQPLDDFLQSKEGHKLYDAIPEILWSSMKINNNSYFICCGGNIPYQNAAIVNESMALKYNIQVEDLTYKEFIEYAHLLKDDYRGSGQYFMQFPSCMLSHIPGYTFICSPFIPLVINEESEDLIAVKMLDIPEYVSLYETLQELYTLNLIAANSREKTNNILFRMISYGTKEDFEVAMPNINKIFFFKEDTVYPLELIGNCVSVVKDTPNVDIAQRVLAEIYTNERITNLLVYGEEHVDYCVYEERAVTVDTLEYVNPSSIVGNMFISLPHLYQSKEKNIEYIDRIHNMNLSKISGFIFDGTDVVSELEEVTNIMNTIYSCDNDLSILSTNLSDLENDLNDAGLEKIQKEVNRQLQDWYRIQGENDIEK